MITKSDIETAIGEKIALSPAMQVAMENWYQIFLGEGKKEQKIGLHLANSICTEFCRLLFAESEIKIEGENLRAQFLQEQLSNLLPLLQTKIGVGLALGGMVLKPYVIHDEIAVDTVRGDCLFPISFSANGAIHAAVFSEQYSEHDRVYTRLEHHRFDQKRQQHIVSNYTFRSDQPGSLGVPCELSGTPWAGMQPTTVVATSQPLFGYFKVPKENYIDPSSPLGISVYANAIPQILQADDMWSAILWEYESKETAVFATSDLFNRFHKLSEHDKRLYKVLNRSDNEKLLPYSPEIRDSSMFTGLNKILQRIEFACHFAYGTLSEPTETEKTATEIKMSKQRSYVFVSALQQQLEAALQQLLLAMDKLTSYHQLAPEGEYTLSCNWGDSVLEDAEASFQREVLLTQNGWLKPEILLSHLYQCSEEEALNMMPAQASNQDFSLFGGES